LILSGVKHRQEMVRHLVKDPATFGRKITRTKWIFKIKKSVTTKHTIVDSWVPAHQVVSSAVIMVKLLTVNRGKVTQCAIKVRVIHQLIVCRRPPQAQAQAQATHVTMATDACGMHGQKILTGDTFTKMEAKQFLIASVRVGVMADRLALRLNTLRILFTALIGTQIHVLIVTLLGHISQVLMARLASSRRRRHLRLHVGAHLLGEATGSVTVRATTLLATMTMVIARRLLQKKVTEELVIGTANALRVRALAPTVAAPKESPRAAPIAIQTEIVPRVVLDITSRATSASNVIVEKQVLLDRHLRALAYRCQKKKTVALAMTTAIARVTLVVVGTAVV
jgi:hypothetical protein